MVQDLGNGQSPIDIDFVPTNPTQFDQDLDAGLLYVRIDTMAFPGGEIRGQLAEAERQIPNETFDVRVGLSAPTVKERVDPHHSKVDDNVVNFDLVEEPLDSFSTGARPVVDENEIPLGGPFSSVQLGIRSDPLAQGDLFPPGFTKQGRGVLLVDGCIEFGMQDPLSSDREQTVRNAFIQGESGDTIILPSTDVTDQLGGDFDGTGTVKIPGLAGQNVDRVQLTLEFEDTEIFADGFESGDTSAWTD